LDSVKLSEAGGLHLGKVRITALRIRSPKNIVGSATLLVALRLCLDDELSDSGMRAELVSAPTKRKRGRPKKISVAPVKNKKTSATPAAAATDTIVYCPYCKENIKLKDQQTLKRHIRPVDQ
jgi:hypothetical protein